MLKVDLLAGPFLWREGLPTGIELWIKLPEFIFRFHILPSKSERSTGTLEDADDQRGYYCNDISWQINLKK